MGLMDVVAGFPSPPSADSTPSPQEDVRLLYDSSPVQQDMMRSKAS